jgi:hypothetical protein
VVNGADDAEIRFLTVNNTGSEGYVSAINNSHSLTMTNVTAMATGGSNVYAVFNNSSSPTMTNVIVTASGGLYSYGIYNLSGASPTMANVITTGSGATYNYGLYGLGVSLIDRSTFDGTTSSIAGGGNFVIGASKRMSAGVGVGTYNCVGVYKYIGGTLSSADGNCN